MSRQASKTQVSLRIPIETLAQVRAEAREEGETMSEVLRKVWILRCRMGELLPHQRIAIVDTKNDNTVVEFIDVRKSKAKRKGPSKNGRV